MSSGYYEVLFYTIVKINKISIKSFLNFLSELLVGTWFFENLIFSYHISLIKLISLIDINN